MLRRMSVHHVPADGPLLRSGVEAIEAVYGAEAEWFAVPVERLDPAFFDLSSGVAGDFVVEADVQVGVETPGVALGGAGIASFRCREDVARRFVAAEQPINLHHRHATVVFDRQHSPAGLFDPFAARDA